MHKRIIKINQRNVNSIQNKGRRGLTNRIEMRIKKRENWAMSFFFFFWKNSKNKKCRLPYFPPRIPFVSAFHSFISNSFFVIFFLSFCLSLSLILCLSLSLSHTHTHIHTHTRSSTLFLNIYNISLFSVLFFSFIFNIFHCFFVLFFFSFFFLFLFLFLFFSLFIVYLFFIILLFPFYYS